MKNRFRDWNGKAVQIISGYEPTRPDCIRVRRVYDGETYLHEIWLLTPETK